MELNDIFKLVCNEGYIDILKPLLDQIDLTIDDNHAIRWACENGHFEVVKLLLNLPAERGVDPSADYNYAIQFSSENGHLDVVKLLLKLPSERGVDPTVNNNWAIRLAIQNGHLEVVKVLKEHIQAHKSVQKILKMTKKKYVYFKCHDDDCKDNFGTYKNPYNDVNNMEIRGNIIERRDNIEWSKKTYHDFVCDLANGKDGTVDDIITLTTNLLELIKIAKKH